MSVVLRFGFICEWTENLIVLFIEWFSFEVSFGHICLCSFVRGDWGLFAFLRVFFGGPLGILVIGFLCKFDGGSQTF